MKILIACTVCGKEIEASAQSCPHCGAPNKKSSWNLSTFVIIAAVLIIISLIFHGYDDHTTSSTTLKPQEAAYSSAQGLDYRKAMLVQIPNGTLLSFTGRISHIAGSREAMISTKKFAGFSYAGDLVFLTFPDKPQVVKGDVVRIFGRYNGTKTYTTVLRSENVVPLITVDYYKVIQPRS